MEEQYTGNTDLYILSPVLDHVVDNESTQNHTIMVLNISQLAEDRQPDIPTLT